MSWQNKTIGQGINWAREKKKMDRHKGEKQIPKRTPVLDCPVSCETPSRCLDIVSDTQEWCRAGTDDETILTHWRGFVPAWKVHGLFLYLMAHGAFPQSQCSSSGVWLLPATSLMERQSKTKQWEINKYFLELLPPKECDRINQNVVNSVHRTRTGNLKEHESTELFTGCWEHRFGPSESPADKTREKNERASKKKLVMLNSKFRKHGIVGGQCHTKSGIDLCQMILHLSHQQMLWRQEGTSIHLTLQEHFDSLIY